MNLTPFFKSIIEEDKNKIVICNLEHEIIYMNPAAMEGYSARGGTSLAGRNLLDCHNVRSRESIRKVVAWFEESKDHNRIYTSYNEKENMDIYMVALRDAEGNLIGYYEKHECRNAEKSGFYQFD